MKFFKIPILVFITLCFLSQSLLRSQQFNFLKATPKKGDGIFLFMQRHGIPYSLIMRKKFKAMNYKKFGKNGELWLNHKYNMPIEVKKYDGKTIRSSIRNNDYNYAKEIEIYNDRMFRLGVKPNDFRTDREIWIPLFELKSIISTAKSKPTPALKKMPQTKIYPIFGENYKKVTPIDSKLEGCVYYLVSGHGGPDPGAIGKSGGYELHEDEYAYDVTLRLAHKLLQHNATVFIIVQDTKDGIRSDNYLNNSFNEHYYGGDTIDIDQKIRLRKRVEIINSLYTKNKKNSKLQQTIVIHVDSRSYGKRIDIFFYYAPGSNSGKKLAETLQSTIEDKYNLYQPGRGYQGSVSSRNLYILRNTHPTCTFIELGNIRNINDQKRLILENNRKAIAKWLCDGIIKASGQ
ncbi:N-acetylmuramoyl-L-alanine amidase [Bacteroidota bacterium]